MTRTATAAHPPCPSTPGCPGVIEDGYCSECGRAPRPARVDPTPPPPPAPASPAPASPAGPGAGCPSTPGCPGVIDGGYCTECGRAPRRTAAAPAPRDPHRDPVPTVPRTAPVGGPSTGTAGSARTPAGSVRNSAGSARSSTRRRIGAGLVAVPPVPWRDPATVVRSNPQVPEDKRFCAACGEPVGRGRPERPARPEGFCPACGQHYSFTPKLRAGDLVGRQYEVVGALAHGGLGWIYLATDRNVSDRWVVLKGLLNAGDAAAAAAAVAEQRFLAEVEHPNIVKIYNFVQHDAAGYIVMEYVGGASLKDILAERREAAGRPDPLPLEQAVAYLVEILPAFGYLHEHGLLFCDFKPDNVIQTPDQLKLIDLGAVVRAGDTEADLYGTVGFQAPEIETHGPSVESDLYTVGRTLAVLATDFRGYQTTFRHSLPERHEFDVYQRFESLYRFLQRACAADPADRFHSAEEMSEQLLGVLREVLAAAGERSPAPSRLFTGERRSSLAAPDPGALPAPLPDPDDPGTGYLTTITATDPDTVLELVEAAPTASPELECRAVRALLDRAGAAPGTGVEPAAQRLRAAVERYGSTWRLRWYAGLVALAAGRPAVALAEFERVLALLPGEPAPQLALATAAELAGDHTRAAAYYDTVSTTDPAFTTACAGLARCHQAGGDRAGAVAAYDRIPGTSAAYAEGRVGAIRALVAPGSRLPELVAANQLLTGLAATAEQVAELRVALLEQALAAHGGGTPLPADLAPDAARAGTALRTQLESSYRTLARSAHGAEKVRLVDRANAVRPRTLR